MSNPPLIQRTQEGMSVYDNDGKKIGSVKQVWIGDEDPDKPGPESLRSTKPSGDLPEGLQDMFQEGTSAMRSLPHELRSRMLRYGFIRIDTGPLSADLYATPDQFQGVTSYGVTLKGDREDLLKLQD